MTSQITTTRLSLWVSNQPGDSDATYHYVRAARWTPPAGVTLTLAPQTQELSGDDPEAVFAAFRDLAERVATIGHGADIEGEPNLTACPAEDADYACARRSLLRLTSREAATYAEWRAAR